MDHTMGKSPATVGICKVDKDGRMVELHKAPYGQGFIFKDWDAFEMDKKAPCYVPELDDCVYTHEDFVEICGGQENIARELFLSIDWQHPETLLDEWLSEGEVSICGGCGEMFFSYDVCRCPYCGAAVRQKEAVCS